MSRKLKVILSILMVLVVLAGCSPAAPAPSAPASPGPGAPESAPDNQWKWERKVTLVCPWGVGGGADGTIRPLQPLLQDILGVAVEIANVEGAGGANGMDFAYKQPADGYTYVLGTQSIIMLDLQGILPFEYRKEFDPVAKLVHSINLIASSAKAQKDKYSDFQGLLDYAKANPKELSCGMLTATGTDAVSLKQSLAVGLGVDIAQVEDYIKVVNYSSGAEMSSAMVGGHINICITGADEVMGLIESGDIVPLVALSEERMSALPDVQCTGELGIESFVGTWRALYARKGTPQEALDAFTVALKKAWDSPEYQNFLKEGSYLDRQGYEDAAGTNKLMDEEYGILEDYLKAVGII